MNFNADNTHVQGTVGVIILPLRGPHLPQQLVIAAQEPRSRLEGLVARRADLRALPRLVLHEQHVPQVQDPGHNLTKTTPTCSETLFLFWILSTRGSLLRVRYRHARL
jgi:hypothetical protein